MAEIRHPRHDWTEEVDERVVPLAAALWRVTDDDALPLLEWDCPEVCRIYGIELGFAGALLNSISNVNDIHPWAIEEMFDAGAHVTARIENEDEAPTELFVELFLSFPASEIPHVVRALDAMPPVEPSRMGPPSGHRVVGRSGFRNIDLDL